MPAALLHACVMMCSALCMHAVLTWTALHTRAYSIACQQCRHHQLAFWQQCWPMRQQAPVSRLSKQMKHTCCSQISVVALMALSRG